MIASLSRVLLAGAFIVHAAAAAETAAAGESAPRALELLGRWARGPVYASAVSGNHVFLGSGGAIRVLEIDEEAATWREAASIDTSGVVRDLFASGSHL